MKRICIWILTLLVLFGLAACSQHGDVGTTETTDLTPAATVTSQAATQPTQPSAQPTQQPEQTTAPSVPATEAVFTFPANTVLFGVDLGAATQEQAYAMLTEAVGKYTLSLSINGEYLTIDAADIDLQIDQAQFELFCQAAQGADTEAASMLTYSRSALYAVISGNLESSAQDAYVEYSSSQKEFVAVSEKNGLIYDMETIVNAADGAIREMISDISISADSSEVTPEITMSSERIQKALNAANGYLDISLAYTFTPDGGKTSKETLSTATIASFVSVSDSLNVSISQTAISRYASDLGDRYSIGDYQGDFITTGGGRIGFTVDYYGQHVNEAALADDIFSCVKAGTSGTRIAPYYPKSDADKLPYAGNYVEINLSAQYLWVYKDGVCAVSTPIVSGCVANGDATPTGVYSIYDMDRNCWLTGPDWDDYVNYWIGYSGTYGIHDASWRSEFGGDIYIYEGSHGCPNLPVGVAGSVYANVDIGTKVIIYGGATSASALEQEITGTEVYDVASDAAPFKLDTVLKYAGAEVTYTSDNTKVATVSTDGTVTVKGEGSAVITVSAAEFTHHTAAEFKVTITVHSACDEGRHSYGAWVQTVAPSCEPGEETQTCSKCGATQTREIPAVAEHTPDCWVVVVEPTCESEGTETANCTVCGEQLFRQIPALGHSFPPGSKECGNGCGKKNPDYPEDPEEPEP